MEKSDTNAEESIQFQTRGMAGVARRHAGEVRGNDFRDSKSIARWKSLRYVATSTIESGSLLQVYTSISLL
jgi:hypothetical protein